MLVLGMMIASFSCFFISAKQELDWCPLRTRSMLLLCPSIGACNNNSIVALLHKCNGRTREQREKMKVPCVLLYLSVFALCPLL